MNNQDLQIDWLKSFVAIVDAGSLSNATASVHRSQSAVSMHLKKLENATGRRLIVRGSRSIDLTEEVRCCWAMLGAYSICILKRRLLFMVMS